MLDLLLCEREDLMPSGGRLSCPSEEDEEAVIRSLSGIGFERLCPLIASAGYEVGSWTPGAGESRERVHLLSGHTGNVSYVVFSPDGTLLATASDDDAAGLWSAENDIRIFGGHAADVTRAVFSPDGGFVATASVDGTAGLWDVALPSRSSLREKACRIAGCNFTRVEWERFLPGKPYEETCSQWSVNREN